MYPPPRELGMYQLLPQESEGTSNRHAPPFSKMFPFPMRRRQIFSDLWRRRYFKIFTVISAIIFIAILGRIHYRSASPASANPIMWKRQNFAFDQHQRPAYLDVHPKSPLILRLAIMSHVDELEKRTALRETMLTGVSSVDVQLEYKFFVGRPNSWWTRLRLNVEVSRHNDMVVLEDLRDVQTRLSEKRYRALEWTNSVQHGHYDYSMTTDSDAFCRLGALSRRLKHEYSHLNPRVQPILIARMLTNQVYFENTVPDGNTNDSDEDYHVKGPWYSHPIGFGYMLSSNVTQTIFSANPTLPHHVNYPGDDVMIGSWLGGFKSMHDPTSVFETVAEKSPPPQHRVYPKPYLPYAVDTTMIDDTGFHDFKGRGGKDSIIGWDSICVHRMTPEEMRIFREMDEIKTEWDDGSLDLIN